MSFLLDTNVLCESSNRSPSDRVLRWLDRYEVECYLSSISIGEIIKGIELASEGRKKTGLKKWFERLEKWSEKRVIAPDENVMKRWGILCASHEKKGRKLSVLDSLIAATALHHDLTLVTRNTKDYPAELKVLSP